MISFGKSTVSIYCILSIWVFMFVSSYANTGKTLNFIKLWNFENLLFSVLAETNDLKLSNSDEQGLFEINKKSLDRFKYYGGIGKRVPIIDPM